MEESAVLGNCLQFHQHHVTLYVEQQFILTIQEADVTQL